MNSKKPVFGVKKILGIIGCLLFFFICLKAAYSDSPDIYVPILTPLGFLVAGLFAIKSATGAYIQTKTPAPYDEKGRAPDGSL